jgi:uroporphyrinogen decarboxylase
LNGKERVLRTLKFAYPDRIPVQSWMMSDVFIKYGEELTCEVRQYCTDFATPEFKDHLFGASWDKAGTFVDGWGCVWQNLRDGIVGEVKGHPLADYSRLKNFRSPKDLLRLGWGRVDESISANSDKFILSPWSVNPFETMQALRGTEDLFVDLLEDSSEVRTLLDIVSDFFIEWLKLWLAYDLDGVVFSDDFGTQKALLISPALFRKFFKPLYRELVGLCKKKRKAVFFHSDGNIAEIMDDILELGIDAINCQIWLMGIDGISEKYQGKVTFWGELDRQHTLPYGTIKDIRNSARTMKNLLMYQGGGLIGITGAGSECSIENIIESLKCWNE